jgi:hypothetical protein
MILNSLVLPLTVALLLPQRPHHPPEGAKAAAQPTAREILLEAHREVLKAHRTSDLQALLDGESDDYILASRGEVSHPRKAERGAQLGPYLKRTRFTEYKDLIEPIVNISQDESLAWVVVQVGASGMQKGDDGTEKPIRFVSAWIELYEKRGGRWLRVGNVSNFKP